MDKTCSFQKLKWAAALMPTLFTLYQLVTLNSASGPPIPFRFLDHSYFLLCSPWTFEMNSGAINFSDKHCWKWFLGALYQPWQMQVLVTKHRRKGIRSTRVARLKSHSRIFTLQRSKSILLNESAAMYVQPCCRKACAHYDLCHAATCIYNPSQPTKKS